MGTVPGAVAVDLDGRVATVSWHRPPLNVFDTGLLDAVASELRPDRLGGANVVVLRGQGNVWSAGLSVEDHRGPRLRGMLRAFRGLLDALWRVPVPTVAVVEGPCLGGGLELLLPCDSAIASDGATFGQPEIKLGVFPPAALVGLPREIGPKAASDLLLSGRSISAARAAEIGLVTRTVASSELEPELARLLRGYAEARREALVLTKRLRQELEPFPWGALDRAEAAYLNELASLPEAEEGLTAFLEKRPPRWPASRTGRPS